MTDILSQRWLVSREGAQVLASAYSANFQALMSNRAEPVPNTSGLTRSGNVGILAINGVLFPKNNFLSFVFGWSTCESLSADLSAAESDSSIKSLVLAIDSPGGAVVGINHLAREIKAFKKPVSSFVTGACCSGAYWLASATNSIFTDETALSGSIGTLISLTKNPSNVIEIVSTGAPLKRPDPATSEGKAAIQQIADDLERVFIETVAANRRITTNKVLSWQGNCFVGARAVSQGMVDGVGVLDELVAYINHANSKKTIEAKSMSNTEIDDDEIRDPDWENAHPSSKYCGAMRANVSQYEQQAQDTQQDDGDTHSWAAVFGKVTGQTNPMQSSATDSDDTGWAKAFLPYHSRTGT